MNGNDEDIYYRYKMSIFNVTIGGRGNGIFTIFNNMEDISNSLNHPEEVIFKYLAQITGSSYNSEKKSLTGTHTPDKLKEIILEYIRNVIMCSKCNIPETIPHLIGSKKRVSINLVCSACKNDTPLEINNGRKEIASDIIIKYLKNDKPWKTTKTMVSQVKKEEDLFSPF